MLTLLADGLAQSERALLIGMEEQKIHRDQRGGIHCFSIGFISSKVLGILSHNRLVCFSPVLSYSRFCFTNVVFENPVYTEATFIGSLSFLTVSQSAGTDIAMNPPQDPVEYNSHILNSFAVGPPPHCTCCAAVLSFILHQNT